MKKIAIVNYGMGNLFSVRQACQKMGMYAVITSERREIAEADAIILPGVGAFGAAMEKLRAFRILDPIERSIRAGKPFLGICLGFQLLMETSEEFGKHRGLGILPGTVEHFGRPEEKGRRLKVPHVGWNAVWSDKAGAQGEPNGADYAQKSMMSSVPNGESMYFVHSYVVNPQESDIARCYTKYGGVVFCSAIEKGNVFACQFHPERSGDMGLRIYSNFAQKVQYQ